MNEIGWPQDGAFTTLLSTVGYYFDEKDGRMVIRRAGLWSDPGSGLSVLIFELWVASAAWLYLLTSLNSTTQTALQFTDNATTSSTSNRDLGRYHRLHWAWSLVYEWRGDWNAQCMHPCVPIVACPCDAKSIQEVFDRGRPYTESPKDTQKQSQYVFIAKDHTGVLQNKLNISTFHRIQIQKP